jgi:hypothetical protein
MKKALFILMSLISFSAVAVPVMNENVANNGTITIYPDHVDKNRFYVAPNIMMIAKNDKGVPYFSYSEFSTGVFSKAGLIQMTLIPQYTREELEVAKSAILASNKNAEFSGVPFVASQLIFSTSIKSLISDSDCSHVAGLIGQEQACQLILTKKGIKLFYKALKSKNLFTVLQFQYDVDGVINDGNGHFQPQKVTHGVAARIDGSQIADFPNLIKKLN